MSRLLGTAPIVTGKRKRTTISYAEIQSDDFEDDEEAAHQVQSDSDDDDATFGSKRKPMKKKTTKRAKLSGPRKAAQAKPFRFLDLPAELRDMIYELALTDTYGISLVPKLRAGRRTATRSMVFGEDAYDNSYGYWPRRRGRRLKRDALEEAPKLTELSPTLLLVNKQIYNEGINFLYQQDFIFDDTVTLFQFLAVIGVRNQPRLLNLEIKRWGSGRGKDKAMNHGAFALLAPAINLQSILIDSSIHWRAQPKKLAAQIYRDAHHFLEAYGIANGDRGAGANIIELGEAAFKSHYYRAEESVDSDEGTSQVRDHLRKLLRAK
ncbi:hypothetical protein B0A48_11831 [Cryoendolithus antarcticus]|uniref:DUF7730 domain-containing protein n=1 Tax=Cryoendolithus antarcticus TaxID=1507870 RepID=A0A1V8SSV6_9PEZI|nr:hypothetical protein B0A48_11831 [Cryoendolithus antarcticus]